VPLLAYGFEDVEEEKSMLEERRGRTREGVTGEEGIMGIFSGRCLLSKVGGRVATLRHATQLGVCKIGSQ
jgi:hypothetical protein